jgi:hypothetical protein
MEKEKMASATYLNRRNAGLKGGVNVLKIGF